MNRRSFLGFLLAVPVIGPVVATVKPTMAVANAAQPALKSTFEAWPIQQRDGKIGWWQQPAERVYITHRATSRWTGERTVSTYRFRNGEWSLEERLITVHQGQFPGPYQAV